MEVALLYNAPTLDPAEADAASEAGVLESVEAIASCLAAAGHQARRVAAGGSADELLRALRASPLPDVVVNLCEGFAGAPSGEPHVASLLELLGLPYTGSPPECLGLVRHKARTKLLLAGAGLPTPAFHLLAPGEPITDEAVERLLSLGPVIVKPAAEDASLGLGPESVVTDAVALRRQVELVRERYGAVLLEQFISGREFNAGIVALPLPTVLPLAEIEFRADPMLPWPIVTYDAKWALESGASLATPVRCPADVEPALAERIRSVAFDAFRWTGCRDYARVDLRVNDKGEVFILEVNGNPDLSPAAGLARAVRASGMTYDEFVLRLVDTARERGRPAAMKAGGFGKSGDVAFHSPHPRPLSQGERGDAFSRIEVRPFQAADRTALVQIIRDCGLFRPDEVQVANEILEETVRDGSKAHYRVLVAVEEGRALGWSCHGLVPLTDATYDLYWIAVHPDTQGRGIGKRLLEMVEAELRAAGARWLIAETSSAAAYDNTRLFYLRTGFQLVGDVPDFYRRNDGRATYGKRLDG